MANFALFVLVGKQLSPRIRDLGKITLCRPGPRAEFEGRYPHAGPLLSHRLNDQLVTARWDDLLRVAASVHGGQATAALSYRRIGRQLSKGENRHSLRRALAYAHEGALRRRHHTQQAEQTWCLTLATNAIVCWMSEYYGLAVTTLRQAGRRIDDEVLAHIWPSHHENVHFYGTHTVDIAAELATLDTNGYRPLRMPSASEPR